MPAAEIVARGARKLGVDSVALRRRELIAQASRENFLRGISAIERAARNAGMQAPALWEQLESAAVLEIGCGQHGGLAPVCLAAGARAYVGVDPGIRPVVLRDATVITQYIEPAIAAATAHLGRRGLVDDVGAQFSQSCRFLGQGLASLDGVAPPDLVVSVSCLEHVQDLAGSLRRLRELCAGRTAHFHIVNFSNHTDTQAPFKGIYERSRDDFLRDWGHHVNGLRVNDVEALFKEAGLPLKVLPLDVRDDALPEFVDPWWQSRYSLESLSVRTALFVSAGLFEACSCSSSTH